MAGLTEITLSINIYFLSNSIPRQVTNNKTNLEIYIQRASFRKNLLSNSFFQNFRSRLFKFKQQIK